MRRNLLMLLPIIGLAIMMSLAQYTPPSGGGGGAPSGPAGGDLAGTYPNPTVPGKQSGLPVAVTTYTALPSSPTYSNGSSGVGATLTAGSAGVLTLDGVTPASGDRILVAGQSAAIQNGIYTLTTVGTVSVPYVLTRATDYDTPAKINSASIVCTINQGTTYASTCWIPATTVTTIGSNTITFQPSGVLSSTGPYLRSGSTPSYYGAYAVTPPPAAGWTWINQGSSSASFRGVIQLLMPATGTNTIRAYVQTLPASTGYTLIVGQSTMSQAVGACISDGTKIIAVWMQSVGTITSFDFTNATSIGGNYFGDNTVLGSRSPLWWIRFQSAGGNRTVSVSSDGQLWDVLNSQADGTFLTETQGGPCYETNTAINAATALVDFRMTTP